MYYIKHERQTVFIAFQARLRDLEYMNAKPSIFDEIQGVGNCDETLS